MMDEAKAKARLAAGALDGRPDLARAADLAAAKGKVRVKAERERDPRHRRSKED